jgi:hypothetical protein
MWATIVAMTKGAPAACSTLTLESPVSLIHDPQGKQSFAYLRQQEAAFPSKA